jgi:arylsulfatase A-like enzyme
MFIRSHTPTALCVLATMSLLPALEAIGQQQPPAPAARRANVVLIVADDLGHADIGAQGFSKDVRTPSIDSIASSGVRFTNAYVSAPVCSPSRAGFLTGRYQQRFGHEANPQPNFDGIFGLPLDQVTLADELKRAGYATGAVGKWHLGSPPEFRPARRGFDEFFGFLGGAHGYLGQRPAAAQGANAIRRNDAPVDEKEYLTTAITREAVSFIDRHKAAPFFLYVPYNAVHTPQQVPPKYVEPFASVKDEKRRLMLAMLAALDEGVGQILGKLRDTGLEENTLVVFISDNGGPTFGNASRNTPFRGIKGELWEGGIRVPFMLQWKGRLRPGQVIDHPVIALDLFPTSLAASGVDPRPQPPLDGVNLLPWLEGKAQGRPHDTLYWRFKPQWAIRDGDYKLIAPRNAAPQLFDLSKDPGEKSDLSKDKPEVAKRLREKYDAWNAQLMEPRWPGKQEGAAAARRAANGKDPQEDNE